MSYPTLLNPTGRVTVEAIRLAKRLDSLNGKVLGILVNTKPHAEALFKLIEKRLRDRHNLKQVVWGKKDSVGHRTPPELVDTIASQCDMVITGTGD